MGGLCFANFGARCRECRQFMYNSEENTFCDKSCTSWYKIIAVYLTYVIIVIIVFVAGLFAINHGVRSSGLQGQIDKQTLIRNNTPKLTTVPKLKKTSLIWYKKGGNNSNYLTPQYYIDYLDKFFKRYENLDPNIYVDCGDPNVNRTGKFCKFTKEMLGPCGRKGYGYLEDKPCVFLKLNKIRGWIPTAHESGKQENEDEGDEETDFASVHRHGKKSSHSEEENYTVTVECTGRTSFECDHLGEIEIYPKSCFQPYYFPFNGSELYLSPLVGVKFMNLVKGMVVGISCTVWGFPTTERIRKMLTTNLHMFIAN